jgi:hypothetical protein
MTPSTNVADLPTVPNVVRFKTLLVCVSTGHVLTRIGWNYDGTSIDRQSIKQER